MRLLKDPRIPNTLYDQTASQRPRCERSETGEVSPLELVWTCDVNGMNESLICIHG